MAGLNPLIFTTIQNDYVSKLNDAFVHIQHYAIGLFGVIAVIEIAIFGLTWALRQDNAFGAFLFKVIKLAVIFGIISFYPYIIQIVINGFTFAALHASNHAVANVFFNPGKIWQYGFDACAGMLKLAVQYGTANVGMSWLYLIMGFGSLTLFGLIGAQIIFVVVGFYIVALVALLLLPFSAFVLAKNFFERATQSLLRIGAMVFTLIMVLGVAITVWKAFPLASIAKDTTLDKPLGLFFATLIIALLAWRLPKLAANVVGSLGGNIFADSTGPSESASVATQVSVQGGTGMAGPAVNISNIAAATSVSPNMPGGGQVASGAAVSAQAPNNAAAGMAASTTVSTGSGQVVSATGMAAQGGKTGKVSDSADMSGISDDTLKKLKSTFKEAIVEAKQPTDHD